MTRAAAAWLAMLLLLLAAAAFWMAPRLGLPVLMGGLFVFLPEQLIIYRDLNDQSTQRDRSHPIKQGLRLLWSMGIMAGLAWWCHIRPDLRGTPPQHSLTPASCWAAGLCVAAALWLGLRRSRRTAPVHSLLALGLLLATALDLHHAWLEGRISRDDRSVFGVDLLPLIWLAAASVLASLAFGFWRWRHPKPGPLPPSILHDLDRHDELCLPRRRPWRLAIPLLLIGLFDLALCVFSLLLPGNHATDYLMATGMLAFSVLALGYGLRLLLDSRPYARLDAGGLSLHMTLFRDLRVTWREIREIHWSAVMPGMIVMESADPLAMRRSWSLPRRLFMALLPTTPTVAAGIRSEHVAMEREVLFDLLKRWHERHGGAAKLETQS
jgi:hypothetical protein